MFWKRKPTVDEITENYRYQAAAGVKNKELGEELFNALRDGHIELAAAIWDLGSRFDQYALVSLKSYRQKIDDLYWPVMAHHYSFFEAYNSKSNGFNEMRDVDADMMQPLSYFCATGNMKAIAFLIERKADVNLGYRSSDRTKFCLKPIYYSLGNIDVLKLLLKNGATIEPLFMEQVVKHCFAEQKAGVLQLCLEYGGSRDVAKSEFAKQISLKKYPAQFMNDMAQILELPLELKKPIEKPIELPKPAETSPDQVTVVSDIGDRKLVSVFNFVTKECVSMVRAHVYAPTESHETKTFEEMIGHADLKAAFAEHQKRGGKLTEKDLVKEEKRSPLKIRMISPLKTEAD